MQALKNSDASADESYIEFCKSCFYDPVKYIENVYPWGEGELANKSIDKWQYDLLFLIRDLLTQAVKDDSDAPILVSIKACHGAGKTAVLVWIIRWLTACRADFRGVVTANTDLQLRTKLFAELAIWHSLAHDRDYFDFKKTSYQHKYKGDKTWGFDATPWSERNVNGFAGLHGAADSVAVIVDEAGGVITPVFETALGGLTTPRALFLAAGNPTTPTGYWYDTFENPKISQAWHNFTICADDSVAGIITEGWKDMMRKQFDWNSDTMRVRYRGEFPNQGSLLLYSRSLVMDAVERDVYRDHHKPLIMGVDVARRGDDQSGFIFKQGLWSGDIMLTDEKDIMNFSEIVHEQAMRLKPAHIVVDADGVGGGVYDRLKQLGHQNLYEAHGNASAPKSSRHKNMRAHMYDVGIRAQLTNGCIPNHPKLIDDLLMQEYAKPREGKDGNVIRLRPKNEYPQSPDAGDMLGYANYRDFAGHDVQQLVRSNSFRNKMKATGNYDPLAGM